MSMFCLQHVDPVMGVHDLCGLQCSCQVGLLCNLHSSLGAMHARAGPKGRDRPRSGPGGLGFVRRSGPQEEVGFGWAIGEAKAIWPEGVGGLLVRELDQIRFEPKLEYGKLRIKYRKVEIGRTKPKPNLI